MNMYTYVIMNNSYDECRATLRLSRALYPKMRTYSGVAQSLEVIHSVKPVSMYSIDFLYIYMYIYILVIHKLNSYLQQVFKEYANARIYLWYIISPSTKHHQLASKVKFKYKLINQPLQMFIS